MQGQYESYDSSDSIKIDTLLSLTTGSRELSYNQTGPSCKP